MLSAQLPPQFLDLRMPHSPGISAAVAYEARSTLPSPLEAMPVHMTPLLLVDFLQSPLRLPRKRDPGLCRPNWRWPRSWCRPRSWWFRSRNVLPQTESEEAGEAEAKEAEAKAEEAETEAEEAETEAEAEGAAPRTPQGEGCTAPRPASCHQST